jgi:hypothetical protein
LWPKFTEHSVLAGLWALYWTAVVALMAAFTYLFLATAVSTSDERQMSRSHRSPRPHGGRQVPARVWGSRPGTHRSRTHARIRMLCARVESVAISRQEK